MNTKKILQILVLGIAGITTVFGSISAYKYSELKKVYNGFSQKFSSTLEKKTQLDEENQKIKQERQDDKQSLENLSEKYNRVLENNKLWGEANSKSAEEIKELKSRYEKASKDYGLLSQESSLLKQEYEKIKKDFDTLVRVYQTVMKEYEELKKQKEIKDKEAGGQGEIKKAEVKKETKQLLEYNSGYGFPGYSLGFINGQENWESKDSLDKKGWQIIKKSPKDFEKRFKNPERYSKKTLCFKPEKDFAAFDANDNFVTLHLHSDKPIEYYTIGAEYEIEKNAYVDVFVSSDNKNWFRLEHFDSSGYESLVTGWMISPYYDTPVILGIKPKGRPYLGLKNDLYIRHSAGASSNQKCLVEILRFSATLGTKD